jgi:hypothetical protein
MIGPGNLCTYEIRKILREVKEQEEQKKLKGQDSGA